MTYTNKYNLPSSIISALEADAYDDGGAHITASSLWKPTQIVAITRKHGEEIQTDASDHLLSLLGTAFHNMLAAHDTEAVIEKRLFAEVAGRTISGQFDRLIVGDGILQDYKVTSVTRFQHQLRETEWENQLNTYAWLLRRHGIEVKALQIVALLRDWNEFMSERTLDYPNLMLQVADIPLWSPEEAERRIEARVLEHENPSPCTDAERWHRPPTYAVMKNGRKSAVKLFSSESEAAAFISQASDSRHLYLEVRPGSYLRCEKYCSVAPFCPQVSHARQD